MRWAFFAALLLAGCATTRPEPIVRTIEVKVPVPVACVERVPEIPGGLGDMPETDKARLARALERLLEWRAYGIEADGIMRACSKPY
jgi:hypothetical protein